MRYITNSELRTYKECKRKWWLGWKRKLRLRQEPVAGTAASLGTRVHEALAAYYRSEPLNPFVVLERGIRRDAELVAGDSQAEAALEKDADLARAMLEGYVEWLGETGADAGLRIIGDEQKVIVPLTGFGRGDVALMGKLDVRVEREADGARLFMDHKTVGSFGEATKMLHMDEQMLHYHLLEYLTIINEREAGAATDEARADGGLYNMLRKVKRTARATPPFYERVEVRHNDDELRAYYLRVWGEVRDIVQTEDRLDAGEDHRTAAYPTPTRDCTWKCEYFPVCHMLDEAPETAEQMLNELYAAAEPLDRYDDTNEETT